MLCEQGDADAFKATDEVLKHSLVIGSTSAGRCVRLSKMTDEYAALGLKMMIFDKGPAK